MRNGCVKRAPLPRTRLAALATVTAWLWTTIAIALDGAVVLVCALVPDRWLVRYRAPMLGFATGTLLATGLGEILPAALGRAGLHALVWMLGAMLALGAFEMVSSRRGRHRDHPLDPVALLGSDALHNLGDGMAIAAAFVVAPRFGVLTAAAVLVHELPEEIADYALLRGGGMPKRTALAALGAVQLTAGIGAAGTLLASSLLARAEGIVLGVASGMFVYIAAFDLLPELGRARTRSGFIAALAGAAISLVLG